MYNNFFRESTENPYTATVIDNSNYIANFAKNLYAVSVSSNAGGTVAAASNSVEYGSTATLTATPNTGYRFVDWKHKGSVVSNNSTYSPTITENSSYVATFEKIICSISVSSNAGGSVAASSSSVEYGGSVTLTATPNEGYFFQNWKLNGTVVSTSATFTATVTANSNYVATFSDKKGTYTVNLKSQWRKSSSVSNPNSTLYDGVYESYSNYNVHNSTATMTITISGYTTFTLYVRSNAESTYDYVTVSQLDNSSNVKYSTSGKQTSGTTLSSYSAVTFSGIDGGTHTITIKYIKDGIVSNGTDRGYVLIPKGQ